MLKFNVEPLLYTYVLGNVCSPSPFVQINIRKKSTPLRNTLKLHEKHTQVSTSSLKYISSCNQQITDS